MQILIAVAASLVLAVNASAVTNPPHGHYVRDVLGQLSLVCDDGYYGASSSTYGNADHCVAIPGVAHGHYEKDILGQLSLVCDDGYYGAASSTFGNADHCVAIPGVAHGHYEKDILGQLTLVCDSGYYGAASSTYGNADHCVPIPGVAHGHYEKDILGQLTLVCDDGYYGAASSTFGNADHCVPIPRIANGHYEKDILGQLTLVCNSGYYGAASSSFGNADHCVPIPGVAHGHYETDLLGQLVLVCDSGYYSTGSACKRLPSVAHGRYTTDMFGDPVLDCDYSYYPSNGLCVPIPGSSHATLASANNLPEVSSFNGNSSIRDTRISEIVYQAFKPLNKAITLTVACWNDPDFASVSDQLGAQSTSSEFIVDGFWTPRSPRLISLSPSVCDGIQTLLNTHKVTRHTGAMLAVALHEASHAHGVGIEAEANCDAVQLVPSAARAIGLTDSQSKLLGALAISQIRATAPPGYWNAQSCRDGGVWDLFPATRNLG